ncbi:hypothetical protein BU17DRAFT_98631 [Hysterangium stoloniferum]|nr:hypothetical protein BU17DRAFT_98631 [Hysterangium stoloniferum]
MFFPRQVEELTLLQCSLLPDEILEFIFSRSEDFKTWTLAVGEPGGNTSPTSHVSCPAHFSIRIHGSPVWFEVEVSEDYPQEVSNFNVGVRGHNISRTEQQRWQDIVQDERSKIGDTAYPLYELFSLHLLPQLREEYLTQREVPQTKNVTDLKICKQPFFHALFTSHHLKSPQKRRSLQQWASELRLTGLAKVGHPGLIYCSGSQSSVEEFVTRVKGMQWLALRMRFLEPLFVSGQEADGHEWTEVEKIGGVVEEMKKLGRESYVLDLGIGSGGAK